MAPRDRLAARRKARGFTQESLAHVLEVSTGTVAHWEQGSSSPMARHRRPLADKLDVTLAELDRLLDVDGHLETNGHGVPGWLTLYASLEQSASRIWTWQPLTVHALLQTRDYATAVERVGPLPVADEAVLQKVDLRLSRQGVLNREPPLQLSVILDQSVLHRVTGGHRVMVDQLAHLAAIAERSNVELSVLPLDAGVHAASFGAFTVLASAGSSVPQMVCVEDRTGHRYLEATHAVDAHVLLFEHLRDFAMSPDGSLDAIRSAAAKETVQ